MRFGIVGVVLALVAASALAANNNGTARISNSIERATTVKTTTTVSPYFIFDRNRVFEDDRHSDNQDSAESGETTGKISASQIDANHFADGILQKIRAKIASRGFDKIKLPAESKSFNKKIMGVKFYGEAKLYNGTVTGMDSFSRDGDAEIHVFSNGSLRLDFGAKLDELAITYMLKLRFMDRPAQETLSADLNNVLFHIRVIVKPDGHLELGDFDLRDSGNLRIHTRGLGPFNFVINNLAETIGNGVKRCVLESLNGRIRSIISSIINESVYPPQAILALSEMKESIFQKFIRMTKVGRGFFGSKE